jgi:hypothetical protein
MSNIKKLSMHPMSCALLSLLDADNGTSYHIPLYQRDFTWGELEVTDFVQDVIRAFRQRHERFFGTILLSENAPQHDKAPSSSSLYIIDGQQRLTTALLGLTAMRHLALEVNGIELSTRLNDRVTIQGSGTEREPRLFANRANSEFMTSVLAPSTKSKQDVQMLFDGIPQKQTQRRCHALLHAYKTIYRILRAFVVFEVQQVTIDDESPDGLTAFLTSPREHQQALVALENLMLHFIRNSIFVKIQIQDWMESFDLFDGLNNRGMELAKKDVVKNVVLSRAAKSGHVEVGKVEAQWKDFEVISQSFDFSKFLRHWLLLEHVDVSLGGATRLFIQLSSDEAAKVTVKRLKDAAQYYSHLDTPDQVTSSNAEERRLYNNLNRLSAERVRPIMLAALLRQVPVKSRCQVLEALEKLQFRRSAICQLDNKVLEASVQEIASALFRNGGSETPKVIQAINELSPRDDIFVANFRSKSGMPNGVARYMLLKIENTLRSENGQPALDIDDVTLEHIIPKEPREHWKLDGESPDTKSLITQIGNLTLLRRGKNSEASNLSFRDKKAIYGRPEHQLFINRDVIGKSQWSAREVNERQAQLAEIAKKVWQLT